MMLNKTEEEKYLKFITKYCLPETSIYNRRRSITNPETIYSYWNTLLLDYASVDQEAIKRYLCSKPYESFYLKTYWWYIIRHMRLLMDGFKCTHKDCNGKYKVLQVHHIGSDYLHKGEEIKFMDTLRTLCKTCHHTKEHGHEEETPKKKGLFGFLKRNTELSLTRTEDEVPEDPQKLKVFEEKYKTFNFQDNIEIISDSKEYTIIITTPILTTEELRAAILYNTKILLDTLEC